MASRTYGCRIIFLKRKEGLPHGSYGKESACNAGDPTLIPGREDPLDKRMATHSSILAWRIPWRKEPGGLQSMGSQKKSDTTEWLTHTLEAKMCLLIVSVTETDIIKTGVKEAFYPLGNLYYAHLFLQSRSLCNKHKNCENPCCFG